MKKYEIAIIVFLTFVSIALIFMCYMKCNKESFASNVPVGVSKIESSESTMDPVMCPRYNMHEVVKQSVLLEEHLNCPRKRCKDCITKHFLHIIGLCEEAQSLSNSKPDGYCPMINECIEFYNNLYKHWLLMANNGTFKKSALLKKPCDELRKQRKKLMREFLFKQPMKSS